MPPPKNLATLRDEIVDDVVAKLAIVGIAATLAKSATDVPGMTAEINAAKAAVQEAIDLYDAHSTCQLVINKAIDRTRGTS